MANNIIVKTLKALVGLEVKGKSITDITTSITDPGSDVKIPTEKAVQNAIENMAPTSILNKGGFGWKWKAVANTSQEPSELLSGEIYIKATSSLFDATEIWISQVSLNDWLQLNVTNLADDIKYLQVKEKENKVITYKISNNSYITSGTSIPYYKFFISGKASGNSTWASLVNNREYFIEFETSINNVESSSQLIGSMINKNNSSPSIGQFSMHEDGYVYVALGEDANNLNNNLKNGIIKFCEKNKNNSGDTFKILDEALEDENLGLFKLKLERLTNFWNINFSSENQGSFYIFIYPNPNVSDVEKVQPSVSFRYKGKDAGDNNYDLPQGKIFQNGNILYLSETPYEPTGDELRVTGISNLLSKLGQWGGEIKMRDINNPNKIMIAGVYSSSLNPLIQPGTVGLILTELESNLSMTSQNDILIDISVQSKNVDRAKPAGLEFVKQINSIEGYPHEPGDIGISDFQMTDAQILYYGAGSETSAEFKIIEDLLLKSVYNYNTVDIILRPLTEQSKIAKFTIRSWEAQDGVFTFSLSDSLTRTDFNFELFNDFTEYIVSFYLHSNNLTTKTLICKPDAVNTTNPAEFSFNNADPTAATLLYIELSQVQYYYWSMLNNGVIIFEYKAINNIYFTVRNNQAPTWNTSGGVLTIPIDPTKALKSSAMTQNYNYYDKTAWLINFQN